MRLPLLIGFHLCASAAVEAAFAWKFGHSPRAIASHVLLLAEWDMALVALLRATELRLAFRFLLAVTGTLQAYLYALNLVSNLSWGRNMTGRIVVK